MKWRPESSNVFATSDYNGDVKVWDVRASVPLGTSSAHNGKALCLLWSDANVDGNTKSVIVSGGSDCAVKMVNFS